jgi:hypothetical protein
MYQKADFVWFSLCNEIITRAPRDGAHGSLLNKSMDPLTGQLPELLASLSPRDFVGINPQWCVSSFSHFIEQVVCVHVSPLEHA